MKKLLLPAVWLLCTFLLSGPARAQSDGTALSISCPPDLVLLTCGPSAVGHFEVTAKGNDGPVVCVPPSGSSFPLGVTTVTCTATDILGGSTQCSFTITVKEPPSRWPCPALELGLGIPYETVGGATAVVRPGPGTGSPGISIRPNAADPESGIVLKPGTAQVIRFVTVLDFTAPVGSGFDLVLPFDPLHPNDPPILSMRNKGSKGYCVKMNKRFADEPSAARISVVNSNGTVLPPVEFSAAEIDAIGVFDIGFLPDVTNCHVTIEVNGLDGSVAVEFAGPITPVVPTAARRKGWDGCIYGPDRPVKKPTSRVMLLPPVSPGTPPITELRLRSSGWSEVVIEEPSITAKGRKWGDGHVTLMKAYDDGNAIEFVSLAPGGGVHVDLGPTTNFQLSFSHFDDPAAPQPEQSFRIGGGRWPLGLTNRPPPPPIEARIWPGLSGNHCSADYTAWGISNFTFQVYFGGSLADERLHLAGDRNTPGCTILGFGWPDVVGCPSPGVVRFTSSTPFPVFWGDGLVAFGDEIRIIPELPPGEVLPETFSTVECLASEGLQGLLHSLQVSPAAPPLSPLGLACPGNIVTSATSAAGAVVNFSPVLTVGECVAFPYPQVVCVPETGSVFPVGTTTVNCSVTNGCGEVAACSFTVTVDQRPVILTQPTSLVVTAGQPAHLSAEVYSGPTAFYRWEIFCPPTRPDYPFCGCLPAQAWKPLCLGCPPPFVDFAAVTAECGSGYYLVVSNDFGAVTSAVASITVVPIIECPPDLLLLTCSNSAVATFAVNTIGAQGPVVCTPASGSNFPVGVTQVTCVATNYSGGVAECTFAVTVKAAPPEWACQQVGIGVPFEPVGGATVMVRPDTGDGDPAIIITPQPGQPQSGLRFSPGPAEKFTFTTVLDATAPVGSGFEIFTPPNPLVPNAPPLVSMRNKGPKGYCVKTNKKFADDGGTQLRCYSVNTNGDLLDPITFTADEVDAIGVFDIGFQPGVTNCHVTIEIDLRTSSVSIEFDGPIVPIVPTLARHKGWDGCIYGPDRPRPKPPKAARVIMIPPVPVGSPPITELSMFVSGWPQAVVEQPMLSSQRRRWGDGHVTLMKAYDDDTVEFRSFSTNGGVHVDLGHSESFNFRLTNAQPGTVPAQDQLLTRTIGPIRGLTNRPPPPVLDAMLLQGATGAVECSADFSFIDSPTVHVLLYSNGVLVAQRAGVTGQLGQPLFTLPDWPLTLGKLGGATPCRRGTIKLGTVRLPGGSGFGFDFGEPEVLVDADEFRVLAELPPGAPHPDFYSALEFITNDGPTWRVSQLERTLICTPEPILVERGTTGMTLTWSGEGFRLFGAVDVGGPWFDLGAQSPVALDSNHAARFFKLVCD